MHPTHAATNNYHHQPTRLLNLRQGCANYVASILRRLDPRSRGPGGSSGVQGPRRVDSKWRRKRPSPATRRSKRRGRPDRIWSKSLAAASSPQLTPVRLKEQCGGGGRRAAAARPCRQRSPDRRRLLLPRISVYRYACGAGRAALVTRCGACRSRRKASPYDGRPGCALRGRPRPPVRGRCSPSNSQVWSALRQAPGCSGEFSQSGGAGAGAALRSCPSHRFPAAFPAPKPPSRC